MRKSLITFLLILSIGALIAQPTSGDKGVSKQKGISDSAADTLLATPRLVGDSIITYDTYLLWVASYHPVAISANLEIDLAERALTMSRGGFDPMLYGNFREKQFEETDYYTALNAGVEFPTWFGLSFQGGYEDNQGVYLNNEGTVPARGLIHAGVTAQLGAGLLMDSRRAALRQAQIGLDQGRIDRQLLLNKLYFEATRAYYRWAYADRALTIAEEALDLASVRFDGVTESFRFGDVPAIDTVEAYTQVLMRLFMLREAQTAWVEALNFAVVYLWDEDGNVVALPPGIRPEWTDMPDADASGLPLLIPTYHPELLKLQNKIAGLGIDRRLAAEYLRPKIELKYNFLTENISPSPIGDYFPDVGFFENNYTFGAKVAFPILVREARGKMGMAKVKIEQVDQDFENKRARLNAELDALLIELSNLRDQIGFYTENVDLLRRLLVAEQTLFDLGESSIFLVNARETKLIEAENKLNDLMAKEHILFAKIRVVGGEGFPF